MAFDYSSTNGFYTSDGTWIPYDQTDPETGASLWQGEIHNAATADANSVYGNRASDPAAWDRLVSFVSGGQQLTDDQALAKILGFQTANQQDRIASDTGLSGFINGGGLAMMLAGAGMGAMAGAGSLFGTARGVASGLASDNPLGALLSGASGLAGGFGSFGGDGSWGVNSIGGGVDDWGWTTDQIANGDWAGISGFGDGGGWGYADGLDINVPGAGTGVGGMTGPDFSGSDGFLGTIGSILKGGGTAAAGLLSKLFAPTSEGGWGPAAAGILGALIGGTQNKAADIRTETTPWNAEQWGPVQAQAQNLLQTNQLQQPGIPTLPGLPDLANDAHLQAAIQAAVRPVRQNFYDPGGTASQIRTEFGDQYGSSRNQLALGVASGRLAQTEADIASKMTGDLYRTNLAYNQDRAMQDILNTQWTFGQQTNQADKAFTAPWTNVSNAANVFGAAAGKGSTTVQPMPSTPWWQTAAGGAMTGIDAYNKIFGSGTTKT